MTGRNEKEDGEEAKRKREPKLRSKWQVNARFAARNRDRITSPLIEDDVFLHRLDLSKTKGDQKCKRRAPPATYPPPDTHTGRGRRRVPGDTRAVLFRGS